MSKAQGKRESTRAQLVSNSVLPSPDPPGRPKVIATIPCYNEARFIGEVVDKTRAFVDEVIVVDDGSTDDTGRLARQAGAVVVRHEKRSGAGAATRSCFQAAREHEAKVVVTLDGDNQHYPEEIPSLIAPILRGEADLVIGSRFLGRKSVTMPKYREFGIRTITWLFNVGTRVKITDTQCCFRAHSRALVDTLRITEDSFGFSLQVLLEARRGGFRVTEVPATCLYHAEGSTLHPSRHGVGLTVTMLRLRLGMLGRSMPQPELQWEPVANTTNQQGKQ